MEMSNSRCNKGAGQGSPVATAGSSNSKSITKIERVTRALFEPCGLNRFEAERIGEHCLNSTVAELRESFGARLVQRWETVPSRFCNRGVRVLRYWLLPTDPEAT